MVVPVVHAEVIEPEPLRHAVGPRQVGIEDAVEGRLVHTQQKRVVRDPGIRHEHLDRALLALDRAERGVDLFGIGDVAQVFIVFYGAFFPMVVGVYGAYINIDNIYGQAAETLGCHGVEKFWRVTFMAALPTVLVSMRIGLGLAFVSLVAAELIGASSGLGYLVATSATTFQIPNMFVGIITIGVVGFSLSAIFNGVTRFVAHQ